MAVLGYRDGVRRLPAWAEERLRGYLDACGIQSAIITSTLRTPEEQADVMVRQYGTPERAASLYKGPKGRAVLAAWSKNRATPVPAMVAAMAEVGFTSSHMNPCLATADLAPSSIGIDAVGALVAFAKSRMKTGEVVEVEGPPADAAVHIAMAPPVASRTASA